MSKLIITILLTLTTTTTPVQNQEAINGYIEANDGSAYIATEDGNGWILDNRPDLQVGKKCVIVFDSKGTADISDDEIISIELIN